MIKKVRNNFPWPYEDFNGKKISGKLYQNDLQKTNQREIRIEKIIRKKGEKIYVKWNDYDNFFNSWTSKKRHKVNDSIFS